MFHQKFMSLIALRNIRKFSIGSICRAVDGAKLDVVKQKSERMKKFHEKLETEVPIDFDRFNDAVLIDIDPNSGEFIPESEKEPTKWGDWQHGGRVSDF